MRVKYLRIATFLAAALFAAGLSAQDDVFNRDFGIGGGVGAGSCQRCYGNAGDARSAGINCGSPFSGEWGTDYCYIDHSDPDAAYCFSVGHDCCVD